MFFFPLPKLCARASSITPKLYLLPTPPPEPATLPHIWMSKIEAIRIPSLPYHPLCQPAWVAPPRTPSNIKPSLGFCPLYFLKDLPPAFLSLSCMDSFYLILYRIFSSWSFTHIGTIISNPKSKANKNKTVKSFLETPVPSGYDPDARLDFTAEHLLDWPAVTVWGHIFSSLCSSQISVCLDGSCQGHLWPPKFLNLLVSSLSSSFSPF